MANLETVSSLGVAIGTLVLAVATYGSVRAAKRSAEISERALLISNRPLLVPSHIYDPAEKIRFIDNHWVQLVGGHAYAAVNGGVVYFAISLRNIGQGPAVLERWSFSPEADIDKDERTKHHFRKQNRDMYIAPGDVGFWQGTIRDTKDSQYEQIAKAIRERQLLCIHLEYADQEDQQHKVSRFLLTHQEGDTWLASVSKHWNV